jgi:hypothetical protein
MRTELTVDELKKLFNDDFGSANTSAIFKQLGTWLATCDLDTERYILIRDGMAFCVVTQPFTLADWSAGDWEGPSVMTDWDMLAAWVKVLFDVQWRANVETAMLDFVTTLAKKQILNRKVFTFIAKVLDPANIVTTFVNESETLSVP